jgi:hypothetical protein
MVSRQRATELPAGHGGRLSSEQVQQSEAMSDARLRRGSLPGYVPSVKLTYGPFCLFRVVRYIVAVCHVQSGAALIERGREFVGREHRSRVTWCVPGDGEQTTLRPTPLRQGTRIFLRDR